MKDKLKLIVEWSEAAVIYTLIYYAIMFVVLGVWYMLTNDNFRNHPVNTMKVIYKKASDKTKEMFCRMNNKLKNAYIQA